MQADCESPSERLVDGLVVGLYAPSWISIMRRMKRSGQDTKRFGWLRRAGLAPAEGSRWMTIAGVVAMHLAASVAWAQKPGRLPGEERGWLPWAVAAGIIVIICIAGFLNPKRSHLG